MTAKQYGEIAKNFDKMSLTDDELKDLITTTTHVLEYLRGRGEHFWLASRVIRIDLERLQSFHVARFKNEMEVK